METIGAGRLVQPTGEPADRVTVPAPSDATRIRQALEAVLTDDSYQPVVQGVAADMSDLPTARDLLEALQNELGLG